MAKRETIYTTITCPDCGRTATMSHTENDNPMHAGGLNEPAMGTIPKGFVSGPGVDAIGLPQLYCQSCDVPAA